MLTENEAEEFRIRPVIKNWALFRDARRWDAFTTVWHDDGWMTATWFQEPAADIGTWPICRRTPATRSSLACQGCAARRWNCSTARAATG